MSAAVLGGGNATPARNEAGELPLQITFRHMVRSPALAARIRALVSRLEKFDARISHCHVIVAAPPRHRRHGGLYDFHIEIGLPDQVIAVRRARSGTARTRIHTWRCAMHSAPHVASSRITGARAAVTSRAIHEHPEPAGAHRETHRRVDERRRCARDERGGPRRRGLRWLHEGRAE
jgi:hypothetical protein